MKVALFAILFAFIANLSAFAGDVDLTPKQSQRGDYTFILIDPGTISEEWEQIAENEEYMDRGLYEVYYANSNDFSRDKKAEYACFVYSVNFGFMGYAIYYDGKTIAMQRSPTGFYHVELDEEMQANWQKDWNRFCIKKTPI